MKKDLRKEILAQRNALLQQERIAKSEQIASKVIAMKAFAQSEVVLLYAPIKSEVDTQGIFLEAKRLGKEIYYPRVLGEQMEFYRIEEDTEYDTSAYGIREPKPESAKAYVPDKDDTVLVVMPGAVFDRDGNRIGYGGGYYDKYIHWLHQFIAEERVSKVAVSFACQVVDVGMIKREKHDIQVDCIVTEEDVYGKFI